MLPWFIYLIIFFLLFSILFFLFILCSYFFRFHFTWFFSIIKKYILLYVLLLFLRIIMMLLAICIAVFGGFRWWSEHLCILFGSCVCNAFILFSVSLFRQTYDGYFCRCQKSNDHCNTFLHLYWQYTIFFLLNIIQILLR